MPHELGALSSTLASSHAYKFTYASELKYFTQIFEFLFLKQPQIFEIIENRAQI
jgi:hypothetical protein